MEENGLLQTGGSVGGCGIHVWGGECHQEGEDHVPESVLDNSHQTAHKLPGRKALEPLDSNGKAKRSTSPKPVFPPAR